MKREYPEHPLVAVGAVIVRADGKVLLIRRGSDPARGKWSVPGGLVRLGEKLEAALIREVREECRIEVDVGPLLEVSTRIVRDGQARIRFHYVLIDYLCRFREGTAAAGSDADALQWIAPEAIDSLDTPTGIPRIIRKGMNHTDGSWQRISGGKDV